MAKNRLGIIIIMMCVLCLAACGSGSSSKKDADKDRDKVTLTFDGNATTGYTWQADDGGTDVVKIEESYKENDHEKGMVGVGGKDTFVITPLKAGTADVTFTYGRSWEKSAAETHTYKFTVDKDLKISYKEIKSAASGKAG